MRLLCFALVGVALAVSGCARKHKSSPGPQAASGAFAPLPEDLRPKDQPIVTPESALVGKVATVNPTLHFVVLSFPPGHLPKLDQHMNLYRRGLKVGEVKITGPQTDENIVADLVAGDSEAGDEARDK